MVTLPAIMATLPAIMVTLPAIMDTHPAIMDTLPDILLAFSCVMCFPPSLCAEGEDEKPRTY